LSVEDVMPLVVMVGFVRVSAPESVTHTAEVSAAVAL